MPRSALAESGVLPAARVVTPSTPPRVLPLWTNSDATPTRRYPAWEMDEYASIRFTFRCGSARRFPTIIVRKARVEKPVSRVSPGMPRPRTRKTRTIAAKPAAFTAALIIAVTGVGAPS